MSALKIVSILLIGILQSIALFSSLLYAKIYLNTEIIIFTLSSVFFYCLCVDLARDQLQNIAYYPVTNLIFLLAFTISCIISKIKFIQYYWPFVQLLSIILYILLEEYGLRQIIYWQLQFSQHNRHLLIIYLIYVTTTISHLGWGVMISKLVYKKFILKGEYQSLPLSQQISIQIQSNKQNIKQTQVKNMENNQQDNMFTNLYTNFKQFPQIIKIGIVLIPFLINLVSVLSEWIFDTNQHTHGHQHQHKYFSNNKIYFLDSTSDNFISMFLFVMRIIFSGILFHSLMDFWAIAFDKKKQNGEKDVGQMKKSFGFIVLGLNVAIIRVIVERG